MRSKFNVQRGIPDRGYQGGNRDRHGLLNNKEFLLENY